jgi:Helicase associated domain
MRSAVVFLAMLGIFSRPDGSVLALSSVAMDGPIDPSHFGKAGKRMNKLEKNARIAADLRWEQRYQELLDFRARYGHANVPQLPTKQISESYRELANFCRNCRTQYKHLQNPAERHLSYLTSDRIRALESAGFVWNSHDATWLARFQELMDFREQHGHCNVPTKWPENQSLARWVTFQRQK